MPLTTSLRLGSALLHATSLTICWSAFLSLDDLGAINGLDVHLEYGGEWCTLGLASEHGIPPRYTTRLTWTLR